MLMHYLGKLKNQNSVLSMRVKRVSNVTLSSIQQISVKCHEHNCKD